MVWESYSDIEVELIIKNVDRQWIRKLNVPINPSFIDQESELLNALEEESVKLPGLAKEEQRQLKVRRILKK